VLLDRLDLRDVTLVGHSMGTAEAVRYLTRHGAGRVARLVLAGTTLPFILKTDDNPDGVDRSRFESIWDQWRTDFPRWIAENIGPFIGAGLPGCSVSPEMTGWGIRDMEQTSLPALIQCNQTVVSTDFRKELAALDAPALIIHGTADASTPLELTGRKTAQLIPGAELKIYENAPHGLYITHLPQFEADLLDFIAKC
jgi:non-heme chloroperoxidase